MAFIYLSTIYPNPIFLTIYLYCRFSIYIAVYLSILQFIYLSRFALSAGPTNPSDQIKVIVTLSGDSIVQVKSYLDCDFKTQNVRMHLFFKNMIIFAVC